MPTYADASFVDLLFAQEASWGVVPAAMTRLRLTSEGLRHNKQTVMSEELRTDRMRSDVIEVGASADGNINFEFSHGAFDELIECALMSSFSTLDVTAATVSVINASTIAVATTVAASLTAGQWFRVSGAGAAYNGVFRIASKSGVQLTLDGGEMPALATTITARVRGKTITNGTTKQSAAFERGYGDLANAFELFTGMRVNTLDLNVAANAIVTGTASFVGKEGQSASTTHATTVSESAQNDVMNATSNLGSLFLNTLAAAFTDAVRSITLSLNNNCAAQFAIANRTAIGVRVGTFEVTGQVVAYFADRALYAKMISHTAISLAVKFIDASGNVNVLTLPKVYLSSGSAPASGINQDVMLTLDYMAARDPTSGIMLRWDVLDA